MEDSALEQVKLQGHNIHEDNTNEETKQSSKE